MDEHETVLQDPAAIFADKNLETPQQDRKPPARERQDRSVLRWQRRLLPFMIGIMAVMAALFFVFSGLHIYQVTQFIKAADGPAVHDQIQAEIDRASAKGALNAEDVVAHSVLLLEADALDKRYHQAGGLLMSRIWSRQLAFITGMVMAFVGAAFILGKLSEDLTQVSGGGGEWKVAISSASPGIILSFFGTAIIICSLFVSAKLDVTDGPAYVQVLRPREGQPAVEAPKQPPLSLEEMNKLSDQHKNADDAKKAQNR